MVLVETTGGRKKREVTTKCIWNFTDAKWEDYLNSGLTLTEYIDRAAGKNKTGDISATTHAMNGPVPTPEAFSHTIPPVSDNIVPQRGENATGAEIKLPDPQAIAQGRQIDAQQNWKGRGYDTLVFAAPVKVGTETNYIAAVVTKSTGNNRYYLHEVVDQNGNIIYQKKDAAGAIKTDSVTGEPASIGGATTSLDNIVPQRGENATGAEIKLPNLQEVAAQGQAIKTGKTNLAELDAIEKPVH